MTAMLAERIDAAARLELGALHRSTAVTARQQIHTLSSIFGRNHRPHVIGQFAVMLAEAQV